jgi:hypothetical protein
VIAGFNTIAVRYSDYPTFRTILQVSDLPLAAPSASPFGYVNSTCIEQVKAILRDKVKTMPCLELLTLTLLILVCQELSMTYQNNMQE